MSRPVALITGAAHGIGLETARRLSATHRIALLDLDAAALPGAAAQCGADALHHACDITQQDQVDAAVAAVVAEAGGIDVVVSNAGVASGGALRHIDPDAVAATINVNLIGNWRVIHTCLPHIVERRGYVIGVASAAAISPTLGLGAYCASKAGYESLLDVLRAEVKHLGVDVGCAYFLWIDTDMVRGPDREMAAFQHLRGAQPAPLRKTHPVGEAADAIVAAIHGRRRAAFTPGWLRVLSPLRMLLRTRLGERDQLRLAPQLDADTRERVERLGALDAAVIDSPATEAAVESAGRHLEHHP